MSPSRWKNRFVRSAVIEDPTTLLANPHNWRAHPDHQRTALQTALDTVGWVGSVKVNLSTDYIIDGHLRVALAIQHGEPVPVDYYDLTESEERFVIATYDWITAQAGLDPALLSALLDELEDDETYAEMEDVQALLETVSPVEPDEGDPEEKGKLLALAEVVVREPDHQVNAGDVWRLGEHVLVCAEVMEDWPLWTAYLSPGCLFVPYPGVFVPLSPTARDTRLVMVQPDRYIAGHLLDQYAAVLGDPPHCLRGAA